MLTRSQVARRLNKSLATVRRLEGWKLHPRRDANGIHRFDPEEVKRLSLDAHPFTSHGSAHAHRIVTSAGCARGRLTRERVRSIEERLASHVVVEVREREERECKVLAAELLEQLAGLSERQLHRLDLEAVVDLLEWFGEGVCAR